MSDPVLFEETVSSKWTTALFITLTVLCGALVLCRVPNRGWDLPGILFAILALVFLFYIFNYRRLLIRLTHQELELKFGIFTYKIPVENIQDCQLDDPPWYYKYGGAGIHFYSLEGRYRASFNFLEHPRVVVALRRKAGLIREISFTTRHPHQVLRLIHQRLLNYGKEGKP